jgi:hypothetical protein
MSQEATTTGKRAICSTSYPGGKRFSEAKESIAMGSRGATATAWDEFAAECYGLRPNIDEDSEAVAFLGFAICLVMTRHVLLKRKRARESGGSRPGKRPNRDIGRAEGAARVDRDYFCRQPEHSNMRPVFEEREFERRYRVPRHVYEGVREKLLKWEDTARGLYFTQKTDACGALGASTDQKLWSAFRMLSLGIPADAAVEYGRLAESTNAECLKLFARAIVEIFETEWLRVMTMDDAKYTAAHYRGLGFPGCIGCVDCASWKWDACPMAWQGQCKGKEKVPTVRMEVITDDFLRIWWLNFGVPGARNDKQIFNQSPFFCKIRAGAWPPSCPDIDVAGFPLKWWYFLADGIYPHLRFFVTTISSPTSEKEKAFCSQQEGARKAAERVFGVLFKRFQVLYRPCRLWHIQDMTHIVKACCILHNMCVESRRDNYAGSRAVQILDDGVLPDDLEFLNIPDDAAAAANFWREHLQNMEDPSEHFELKKALCNYIWQRKGGDASS